MYEPVLQALRDLAVPGLVLSGSPDEGAARSAGPSPCRRCRAAASWSRATRVGGSCSWPGAPRRCSSGCRGVGEVEGVARDRGSESSTVAEPTRGAPPQRRSTTALRWPNRMVQPAATVARVPAGSAELVSSGRDEDRAVGRPAVHDPQAVARAVEPERQVRLGDRARGVVDGHDVRDARLRRRAATDQAVARDVDALAGVEGEPQGHRGRSGGRGGAGTQARVLELAQVRRGRRPADGAESGRVGGTSMTGCARAAGAAASRARRASR